MSYSRRDERDGKGEDSYARLHTHLVGPFNQSLPAHTSDISTESKKSPGRPPRVPPPERKLLELAPKPDLATQLTVSTGSPVLSGMILYRRHVSSSPFVS